MEFAKTMSNFKAVIRRGNKQEIDEAITKLPVDEPRVTNLILQNGAFLAFNVLKDFDTILFIADKAGMRVTRESDDSLRVYMKNSRSKY